MESLIDPDEKMAGPARPHRNSSPKVVNFNEEEEATCILSLTLLQTSYFKCYVLLPICSFLTLFILPIKLYWSVPARVAWMYSRTHTVEGSTHLYLLGKDGNKEIVKLQNLTAEVHKLQQAPLN
jgi:hypothetical protein